MLMVISPAKSLDFKSPLPAAASALPVSHAMFSDRAAALVAALRHLSPAEVASLMGISDKLALENVHRYADWQAEYTPANARPALFAFNGDVYEGLDAKTLDAAQLGHAAAQLVMLSGLYGLLRPFDLIQPYRLEMGTKPGSGAGAFSRLVGKDLYAYWGNALVGAVNARLVGSAAPCLVNLASDEYFKALAAAPIQARVIRPVFEDWKDGRYRIISFYAKRARGLMARHVICERLKEPEGMQDFDAEGYAYCPAASDANRWVFRRG